MLAHKNISRFELKAYLKRSLADVRDLSIPGLETPLVVRCPIPASNLLAWLQRSDQAPGFYFQSRDQNWEIAGIGRYPARQAVSISFEQWLALQDAHPQRSDLRLFFTRNFSCHETWSEFSLLQNVLPIRYRERIGSDWYETHLIPASVLASDLDGLDQLIALLQEQDPAVDSEYRALPALRQRIDYPEKNGWRANLSTALEAIKLGQLEKVVLARQTDFTLDGALDPFALMSQLQAVQQRVYHFLYMPKPGQTFLGASPERLFKTENGVVHTEALAGTVAHASDQKTSEASLYSEKILHEQGCVVAGIQKRLQRVASRIMSDSAATPVKLADMTHLCTRLQATLLPDTTIDEIITALHPTAAVCGEPEAAAHELINRLEPFPRGLYAGPIGVIRGQDAECAVALRSCLLQPDRLSVFAGAGIVFGSDADSEWAELDTKIATLLKLFQ